MGDQQTSKNQMNYQASLIPAAVPGLVTGIAVSQDAPALFVSIAGVAAGAVLGGATILSRFSRNFRHHGYPLAAAATGTAGAMAGATAGYAFATEHASAWGAVLLGSDALMYGAATACTMALAFGSAAAISSKAGFDLPKPTKMARGTLAGAFLAATLTLGSALYAADFRGVQGPASQPSAPSPSALRL